VPVATGTTETMLAVSFPDPRTGFAVGADGVVLTTTDGGTTWARGSTGVDDGLRDVSFVDATHGWAVGGESIVATTDGGRTWVPRPPPPAESVPAPGPGRPGSGRVEGWFFIAVHFFDRQRGIVMGAGGAVLLTGDGGLTWTWAGDRSYGLVMDASFVDGDAGFATGPPSEGPLYTVLQTGDGGRTWQPLTAEGITDVTAVNFNAVAAPGEGRVYVAGGGGVVLVSADGGGRWGVQRRDTTETFLSMDFAGSRGLAVGLTDLGGTSRASLVATDDGGETWNGRLVDGMVLWDVAFPSPSAAVAVGCRAFLDAELVVPMVDPETGEISELKPCTETLVVRIVSEDGEVGGSGGLPWPVLGAGVAVAVAAAAGVARARRGRRDR
ncbi:MAG: YCF48-related protein, partial [Actinomycetota bacterium]